MIAWCQPIAFWLLMMSFKVAEHTFLMCLGKVCWFPVEIDVASKKMSINISHCH